jgi:hypothetical protein
MRAVRRGVRGVALRRRPAVLLAGLLPRRRRRLAHAPRRFKCRTCGKTVEGAPSWRRQRFCSLRCANQGRQRTRRPEDVSRNDVILELHARGWKAPAIVAELEARDVGWALSAVGVRTVISRARVQAGR